MASYLQAVLRLVGYKGHSPRARSDEEQATTVGSVVGSSTLAPSHILHTTTTGHRIPADDSLTLFRLMLGITAAPHLGFNSSALRPADNVGLYARVVNSEQKAKDAYKVFSAAINACYFLQIIVAAALTALGAANANNKAITAFGAINTVIAGFLSYLKGSGYPARFKHYANEWKKVREFVEHRERDFSLEGCALDVYEVVDAVREMYETTKRDIQASAPESFNPGVGAGHGVRYEGADREKAEAIAGKLRGLDEKLRKIGSHVGSTFGSGGGVVDVKELRSQVGSVLESAEAKAADAAARVKGLGDTLEKARARAEGTVVSGREAAHDAVHDAASSAADSVAHALRDEEKRVAAEFRSLGKTVNRELEERRPRPPREVSVTVAHREGGVEVEGVARK